MRLLKMCFLGFLMALMNKSALAEEWKAVVLKAESFRSDRAGGVVIQLESGRTLNLTGEDWSSNWSKAIEDARAKHRVESAARSSAEPPSDSVANAMISSHCTGEWPDDFRMRKYCQDKQEEGLEALRSRQLSGSLAVVRNKCADEWSGDFRMRDYCEKRQLKALRELNKR